ncbi:hypothetical protein KOW79_010611 [Hemibagrus wyckioides]|uniref:Uncharacterized protein n=1 Tax=Hemibagrus wyckioides TaxID=337641 RepID=A0A9D3SII0_9TELE|nr:hypothetical protein KOW79_010611 [Hemibagrus wyckioides]
MRLSQVNSADRESANTNSPSDQLSNAASTSDQHNGSSSTISSPSTSDQHNASSSTISSPSTSDQHNASSSTISSPSTSDQHNGWRCNALHTQMYMLEGVSRWNVNRAYQAVDMSGTSQSKIYDVRLMSQMNAFSSRVLGCALLPEFTPPGKPTGCLIGRRELTGTPCYKEWTFPSRSVWQKIYCQNLEGSHQHLFNMDMLSLSSRNLKILRVRQ